MKRKCGFKVVSFLMLIAISFATTVQPVFAAQENTNQITQKQRSIIPNYNDAAIEKYMNNSGLTEYHSNYIEPKAPNNRIFNSEEEAGQLPGVTVSISKDKLSSGFSTRAIGDGYVNQTRVRTWKTASNGLIKKASKKGILENVALTSLSFVAGIYSMTVSAILSAVGIVASSSETVKAETYISYRYTYRDGEGKWSTGSGWLLDYRTGMRETYKHIFGAKLNTATNRWTTSTKDYNTAEITEKSTNYQKSDSWLKEQARQYVTTGQLYIETSW